MQTLMTVLGSIGVAGIIWAVLAVLAPEHRAQQSELAQDQQVMAERAQTDEQVKLATWKREAAERLDLLDFVPAHWHGSSVHEPHFAGYVVPRNGGSDDYVGIRVGATCPVF